LLLDEVTEMPMSLQAKLLRVLQEREVERVGGKKPVALNIRIIATSNRDMLDAVAKGAFREDLYYRLNVFPVAIPALRQRQEDIVAIARHFVVEHGGRFGRTGMSLTPVAEAALMAHSWPGNVRELENVIQRALIMASGTQIDAETLNIVSRPHVEAQSSGCRAQETLPASGLAEPQKKADNMKDLEREHILSTLAEVGSRKRAIERLGISERTLRYKLQQYRDEGHFQD
jgi:two-component system response regulator FlrC